MPFRQPKNMQWGPQKYRELFHLPPWHGWEETLKSFDYGIHAQLVLFDMSLAVWLTVRTVGASSAKKLKLDMFPGSAWAKVVALTSRAGGVEQFYCHMCQGLNSHYFHIIGDGHQPNSKEFRP